MDVSDTVRAPWVLAVLLSQKSSATVRNQHAEKELPSKKIMTAVVLLSKHGVLQGMFKVSLIMVATSTARDTSEHAAPKSLTLMPVQKVPRVSLSKPHNAMLTNVLNTIHSKETMTVVLIPTTLGANLATSEPFN